MSEDQPRSPAPQPPTVLNYSSHARRRLSFTTTDWVMAILTLPALLWVILNFAFAAGQPERTPADSTWSTRLALFGIAAALSAPPVIALALYWFLRGRSRR